MSVEATFTITRDEYVRAMRRHYASKLQPTRDLFGSVIALICGVVLLQSAAMPMLAWVLIAGGSILLTGLGYGVLVLPYLIYRWQPKLKSEYRLAFRDAGIGFHTDEIDAQLKWSMYHSWKCDHEFYVLYSGKRDVSVIPRRVLSGEADARLAELLKQRIGPALK